MEAGAEHPRARALTDLPRLLVGIDLGTTNSALAWCAPRGAIRIFDVPQLVAPAEIGRRAALPSFLYFPTDAEREAGLARLPWHAAPDAVAGVLAREHGALVPARQVSSAKSWLSHSGVDRTAALLPWGADEGPKVSPVGASTRLLVHLRDAWNHEQAAGEDARRLERQPIVLTVPASFDEEARELTVQAAREAGFEHLTVLEEPLAALYAWIAAHRRALAATLGDGALILVCDVGGGTTDFSLIRAAVEGGALAFERIAIGEHLLLGGDNLDLALAVLVEGRFGGARLALTQRQTLRRKCSVAKEQLLSDPALDGVRITILGGGRGVVGGGVSADLMRADVLGALASFLPLTEPTDLPARDRRVGLRELGLPYEPEPAITKHLAAFLTRAARGAGEARMMRPDAVLFNGGFFTPAVARERVLDALTAWNGRRPAVLENAHPEAAVAIGAAFYARLRDDPGAARRLVIRAGSGRAYYAGVEHGDTGTAPSAVCILPRGAQEGTRLQLDREFSIPTNQPVAFTLYSTTARADPPNALVTLGEDDEAHRHAPLVTVLRYGKRSRRVPLRVRLTAVFTEVGTLELWCESVTTAHRWRLSFNVRGVEASPLDAAVEAGPAESTASEGDQVVVSDAAVAGAEALLRAVFAPGAGGGDPAALTGDLENALGHGKQGWPLAVLRRLADVLIGLAAGRHTSPAHEARWLNLAGFCARPGFGTPLDAWRVSELRKVYAAGLAFPREVQGQVEWLVLWQRVAAGFNAGQQRELAMRLTGQLGIGQKKGPHLSPQIERESWRLLAALERLDASQRVKFGDPLLDRLRREPRNTGLLWAIGRLGARAPFHGPLNGVVPPAAAERWIARLLALKGAPADLAVAVAQIGARTGDPARDVSEETRTTAVDHLRAAGVPDETLAPLREVLPLDRIETSRAFGEALPAGLTVVTNADGRE